jgi:hypothetical protein
MSIRPIVALLALIVPAVAVSAGLALPLAVSAKSAGPRTPPVMAPPPELDARPPVSFADADWHPGYRFGRPRGVPDLTGLVDLPANTASVLSTPPPTGAAFSSSAMEVPQVVPEPDTGALVALGLTALVWRSRGPRASAFRPSR